MLGTRPWLVRYPAAIPTVWGYLTAPTFPSGCGPVLLAVERCADGVNCAESPLIRRP